MDLFNKPSGTELLNSAVSATWGRLPVATEENECAIIIPECYNQKLNKKNTCLLPV